MTRDLRIAVRREYFEQIDAGTKPYEYRLANDYWKKRLVNREYETVTITLGYPKKGDKSRERTYPYHGYKVTQIQHKEFGHEGAIVFAIPVGRKATK